MTERASKLRVTIATLTVACVLYYIIGGILAWRGVFSTEKYVLIGGIVGGIASVLGLFAFARPSFSQEDLKGLELQSLKRLAESSEEIQKLEKARAARQQEIGTLEEQKRQMEFLVQKASLSLFLQEQHRLYEKRIQDEIRKNKDLAAGLEELLSIDEKLAALEQSIAKDPNVDLLQRIIAAAKLDPKAKKLDFSEYPPLTRAILLAVRDLFELARKLTQLR